MTVMMTISPFGQSRLWAPSSGFDPRRIQVNLVCLHINSPVIEESGHPREGQEAPCSMSMNVLGRRGSVACTLSATYVAWRFWSHDQYFKPEARNERVGCLHTVGHLCCLTLLVTWSIFQNSGSEGEGRLLAHCRPPMLPNTFGYILLVQNSGSEWKGFDFCRALSWFFP
jgi:hypothetical protein